MLDSLRDPTKHHWALSCSAFATIESYAPDVAEDLRRLFVERMPSSDLALLKDMRFCFLSEHVTCVHGGVRLDGTPPVEEDGGALVWGHPDFPEEYRGTARVCYGHHDDGVEDSNGWPGPRVTHGRAFGIDTISHGVLTAMRFPDLAVFQSARHRGTK